MGGWICKRGHPHRGPSYQSRQQGWSLEKRNKGIAYESHTRQGVDVRKGCPRKVNMEMIGDDEDKEKESDPPPVGLAYKEGQEN